MTCAQGIPDATLYSGARSSSPTPEAFMKKVNDLRRPRVNVVAVDTDTEDDSDDEAPARAAAGKPGQPDPKRMSQQRVQDPGKAPRIAVDPRRGGKAAATGQNDYSSSDDPDAGNEFSMIR